MTAEGYKSSPLSDELERRIRERLILERNEARHNAKMDRRHMSAICDGRVAALEWVLSEADVLKLEFAPHPACRTGRDHICPDCGHVHEGKTECTHYLGEGKFCKCEAKVTA